MFRYPPLRLGQDLFSSTHGRPSSISTKLTDRFLESVQLNPWWSAVSCGSDLLPPNLSGSSQGWVQTRPRSTHEKPYSKYMNYGSQASVYILQQNNKPAIEPSMTHWIPKTWSICTHKECATGQWRRRWSTDFPLQRNIQHQFAKERPLIMRLSNVRIWQWAVVP